jgi:hypothetical protein
MGFTALEREAIQETSQPVIKPRPATNDALLAHQLTLDIRAI